MKSAITVSLVSEARGGPFVFWEGLASAFSQAAALGFDAVEIFPPSAEAIDRDMLRRLCGEHGLAVAAIGTGGGWILNQWHLCHGDPTIREQARHFIGTIVDLAAEFGAPAIVGSMQGRVEGGVARGQALEWLGDALGELGARAAAQGEVLLYEPLNRYETNLFNRLADAADFLDDKGIEPVRLLADLFHMNIEEASIAGALHASARRIGHVHFADSNRRAIGFGHTEVAPVMEALRGIGYEGYLSAEIVPLPDSHTAAAQAMKAFRQFVRHS
ncbi:MAG: sugar phosphate isomerase/epimerase family protein [Verrucomicrobiota bacterium]